MFVLSSNRSSHPSGSPSLPAPQAQRSRARRRDRPTTSRAARSRATQRAARSRGRRSSAARAANDGSRPGAVKTLPRLSFVKTYGSGNKDRDAGLPGQHGSRRRQLSGDTRNASVWPLEGDPAEGATGGGKSDLGRRERQSKDSGHNAHARSTRHRGPRCAAERGACRDHKDPKHQLHARTIGPVPTTIAARSTGVGYTSGCLRRRFLPRNSVLSTLPGQKLGKSFARRSGLRKQKGPVSGAFQIAGAGFEPATSGL